MTTETTPPAPEFWKKCNSCKTPIPFGQIYYVCSVSTCTRVRTGLVFCSVSCWDAHGPIHRNAGAIECKAPTLAQWLKQLADEKSGEAKPAPSRTADPQTEVLVVVSKVKAYVRERYGMNTSDAVIEILSGKVREIADKAILQATRANRQTLLERDCE